MHYRDHVVLEHFTRPQSRHCDMLLPVIGVDRRLAFHRGAEILHRVVSRLDHAAILLEHPNVRNLHPLVGRVVAQLQLSPLLHPGFALHTDAGNRLPASGAVALEAVARSQLLDDKGFLRVVGLLILGLRSFIRGLGSGRNSLCRFLRLCLRGWRPGIGRGLAGLQGIAGHAERASKEKDRSRAKKVAKEITHK